MERNLLNREINSLLLNTDAEFGSPQRSPSGTVDDKVIISWENKLFAHRDDQIKRVYIVNDGTRTATFRIKVSNTGSDIHNFFNRFFIARLFYETTGGQDSGCRASKGMNCIKWKDNKYNKKISIPHDEKAELAFNMPTPGVPYKVIRANYDIKSIPNLYIEIPPETLQEVYRKVDSQLLTPQKTTDRLLNGKVYLEITFYWQEYIGRSFGGKSEFENCQSKPINITFFPVNPVYFFFPPKKVPMNKSLEKRIKEFKEKHSRQLGYGVSSDTTVSFQLGSVKKSETNTGMGKTLEISSEIKTQDQKGMKAEITIPVLDFIKWEGSVSKTREETEKIVNSYTTSQNLMEGIEHSFQQNTEYKPQPGKAKKRRFFMVPIVEPIFVKSVIYTPINKDGFATNRIARPEEEIFLKIKGWDIEQRFEK